MSMGMSMSISMSMIHREIRASQNHREPRARTTQKPLPEPQRNQSQNHRETAATRYTEKPDPEPQRNPSQIRREIRVRTTQKMAFLPPKKHKKVKKTIRHQFHTKNKTDSIEICFRRQHYNANAFHMHV